MRDTQPSWWQSTLSLVRMSKQPADELVLAPVQQSNLITRIGLQGISCSLIPATCVVPAAIFLICTARFFLRSQPEFSCTSMTSFIPYDYPNLYDPGVTRALSTFLYAGPSVRYRTVFATHMLSRQYRDQMQAIFGILGRQRQETHYHFGCSFWFEVRS